MEFISTPLQFWDFDSRVSILRSTEERITMLDNLVELIVFTPRGSFSADPDFGFEYWSHEYTNVNAMQFNNNNTGRDHYSKESAKMRCQESIRQSLQTYAPELKDVEVTMNLEAAEAGMQGSKKVLSRYVVYITVEGSIDDGLGTTCAYQKDVVFLIEPTSKRVSI